MATRRHDGRRRTGGLTLVELLVALAILALMAALGWRGLDAMARAQERTREVSDALLGLQAGLSQWGADLDAVVQTPQLTAVDWDGRVLRITRRSAADSTQGIVVAAWTRRAAQGQWLRWQSPPCRTRGELRDAWTQAGLWAQSPGDAERAREIDVVPLADWRLFFFRENAWTNPLSSDATSEPATGPVAEGVRAIPDGVRVVLELPAGQPLAGRITRDWARPTLPSGRP